MSFLCNVCSRLKNVKRGMFVFFGSASVLFAMPGGELCPVGKNMVFTGVY